jgi:hypothetical protein
MSSRILFATLLATALATAPLGTAEAGNTSHSGGGLNCGGSGGGGGININKPVNIYKPTTINNNVNIFKPVTVNKNINIYKPTTITNNININKPVTINKNITIVKNIDASKSININKTIIINKGGGASAYAYASAFAAAMAQASASANASVSNNLVIYSGYNEYITVNNRSGGGEITGIQASGQCEMQDANVIKAIHAVCVAPGGQEFPASHMTGDTWIDTSRESEILRCIPGAHLRVTIGDILQSDQGLAGSSSGGQLIECTENEALRHFKDGMVKCTPKVPVKDCTERTNLRLYGTGDLFFSYRARVCVGSTASAARPELELTGLSLDGGVGSGN